MTISSILREILRGKEGRIILLLFCFSLLCLMGLMGSSIDYFSHYEIFMHIAESWAYAAYSHLKKSRWIGTKRKAISAFVFFRFNSFN